jgi:hypothetical protein
VKTGFKPTVLKAEFAADLAIQALLLGSVFLIECQKVVYVRFQHNQPIIRDRSKFPLILAISVV